MLIIYRCGATLKSCDNHLKRCTQTELLVVAIESFKTDRHTTSVRVVKFGNESAKLHIDIVSHFRLFRLCEKVGVVDSFLVGARVSVKVSCHIFIVLFHYKDNKKLSNSGASGAGGAAPTTGRYNYGEQSALLLPTPDPQWYGGTIL